VTAVDLDVEGPAAPPRSNGELVFAEPWESRAFGLTMTLAEGGAFTWDEFRDHLITRIGAWEEDHPEGECYSYYRCWVEALERVLDARGLLPGEDVTSRAADLADRPAGWDHGHEHGDHGHGHGHDHGHDH
jgi:nitrile hydratase accessory protein